ncbi:MAG: GDP-L-fucose synthase [Opitutales bacterium]|nr:GDP-L-fucose synthase [Opitutales bacterium]
MNKTDRIYVAGHRGMVGSAIVRALEAAGYENIILRTHRELDLMDAESVAGFFKVEQPEVVIDAAAKVGGIHANDSYPADFLRENISMQMNIIDNAWKCGAKRLLFLGSSCIYPRMAPQPMPESCLLTSELEKTNEAYALAKITGLKYCQYLRRQYGVLFHSAMPTNLYGPHDNYHPQNSHVLPALIRRFHEAKLAKAPVVTMWGTGKPLREFLHADDLASAALHLLSLDNPPDWVNVGSGSEVTIAELAELVKEAVGYEGRIEMDESKPDGTPRKLLDISLIRSTGWEPKIPLKEGLARTYRDFLSEAQAGALRD